MLDASHFADRPLHNRPVPDQVRRRGDAPLRQAAVRQAETTPASRTGLVRGLASGFAGFVVGAVFWHFVGFWSFVSNVVLKGPGDASGRNEFAQSSPPPQQPVKVAGRFKDAVRFRDLGASAGYLQAAVGAGNCAEVKVDRTTGQAGVQACTLNVGNLPSSGTVTRSDQLKEATAMAGDVNSRGWSVQVQAAD